MENFVTINSLTAYQHSQALTGATVTKSSVASTPVRARDDARRAAESAATVGTPSPGNGGSIGDVIQLGRSYSGVVKHTSNGTMRQVGTDNWQATASCYKTTSGTGYQLKINFTLPEGIQSSNINNAKLSFKYSALYGDLLAAVLAPATNSEQTSYLKPVGGTTAAIVDDQFTISYNEGESSEIEDIDITNSFKACLDNQQGWITLSCPSNSISSSRRILVLNEENSDETSIKISYELDATPCVSPDPSNISMTSIVAPGGNLEISWCGATSGINNNIAGYSVCYKLGEDGVWAEPETISLSPTVSGQDGSRSVTFQIPTTYPNPNVYRGKTIYVAITTLGEYGSEFNSTVNISDGKINSLPEAPSIISVDKTRLKSTGDTNVTFVINPGADNDDPLQTKTIKYSFSAQGTKSSLPNDGVITISSENNTIYFWTYDGLEYSSSYTQKDFIRNTVPQIGSVSMTTNDSYQPQVSIDSENKIYAKVINGTATGVSVDPSSTRISYNWKIYTGTIETSSENIIWSSGYTIGTGASLTNIDITLNKDSFDGVGFNTAYKLELTVTDDIGESISKFATEEEDKIVIYAIPPAPTVLSIINRKDSTNALNTNPVHFWNGMRFNYNTNNTGIVSKIVEYSTSHNGTFTSLENINLDNSSSPYYTDVTLPENIFTRENNPFYYFRVVYKLNTNVTGTVSEINSSYYYNEENTTVTKGYSRAKDMKPTASNIVISPSSGNIIKPYSQISFTCQFNNQLSNQNYYISDNDVSSTIEDNYRINFLYQNSSPLSIPIDFVGDVDGTITFTGNINGITAASWETFIGSGNLNDVYKLTLEVIPVNGFGETFRETKDFSISFKEGFKSNGSITLKIQTGENVFTTIPNTTYDSNNRYPLFQTQTLNFEVSGIQCYAKQRITFNLYSDSVSSQTLIGSFSYADLNNDWTADSTVPFQNLKTKKLLYTLKNVINTSSNKDFYIEVILGNGKSYSFSAIQQCKYVRVQTSAIKPSIDEVTENAQTNIFSIRGTITDYGGDNSDGGSAYSGGYSNITLQYMQCATPSGTYSALGQSFIKKGDSNPASSDISLLNFNDSSPIISDVVYIGLNISLTLDFVQINGQTPTGKSVLDILTYKNLGMPLYRETPNLLYGKNFFGINTSSPLTNISDQVLEIHQIGNRNKIYFYNGSHYIQLPDGVSNKFTVEGLVIDCGTWNSN